jgi:hypothetical protein
MADETLSLYSKRFIVTKKSALNGLTTLLPFQDVTLPKAVAHSCVYPDLT